MKVRQRLWWVLGGVFLLFCVGFVVATYRFGWSATGFLNKSLWDWLQLLVIPFMLAVGGFWLNQIQKSREEKTTERRAEIEQELTLNSQREAALQGYLGKVSELLFEKNLHKSEPEDEVRTLARARTLTVLRGLDASRKGNLIQFLHEAHLINILDLSYADLSKAALSGAKLSKASLREANLREANLSGAELVGVNLSGADLSGADLIKANLSGANLSKASLSGTLLIGANLSEAILSKAKSNPFLKAVLVGDVFRAELVGANLSGADLREAYLNGANLSGADLSGANLSEANLSKTAQWNRIDFALQGRIYHVLNHLPLQESGWNRDTMTIYATFGSGTNLSGANLSEANLLDANLSDANLERANLSEAKLATANLTRAKMSRIYRTEGRDFRDGYSDLVEPEWADLVQGNLAKTLRESDYRGEILSKKAKLVLDVTILQETDLTAANLKGAGITDQHLSKVKSLEGATMPDGTIHP